MKAEHLIWARFAGGWSSTERKSERRRDGERERADESVADGKCETRPQTSLTLRIASAFREDSYMRRGVELTLNAEL